MDKGDKEFFIGFIPALILFIPVAIAYGIYYLGKWFTIGLLSTIYDESGENGKNTICTTDY